MDGSEQRADRLRTIILGQSAAGVAVPVLLFSTEILDRAMDAEPRSEELARLAADLDLDPDEVELFSPEAYLLQCALGQRLLDDPADSADPTVGP